MVLMQVELSASVLQAIDTHNPNLGTVYLDNGLINNNDLTIEYALHKLLIKPSLHTLKIMEMTEPVNFHFLARLLHGGDYHDENQNGNQSVNRIKAIKLLLGANNLNGDILSLLVSSCSQLEYLSLSEGQYTENVELNEYMATYHPHIEYCGKETVL